MDEIKISNLEVFGHHGVYAEENTLGQKFLVTARLFTDTKKAGKTDALEDSIDYGDVCRTIKQVMEAQNYKLLETVAEKVAQCLLCTYPSLEGLQLEIKKPWAPIMLPIDTVSVVIERSWHTLCLSIGSNLGNRKEHLDYGVERLRQNPMIRRLRVSTYLETEPYGYTEQPRFLNACIVCQTLLSPMEVLELAHAIEGERNRTREIHWGPRTLDLDILFYDDAVIEEETLTIPHPEMELRQFVLEPLAELVPGYRNPANGKTVRQMLTELGKKG